MVLWIETASQSRLHAQQYKIIRRDNKQPHPRRSRRAGEIILVVLGRRNVVENSGTLKVLPLRLGKSYVLRAHPGEIILDAYELLRSWIRQRMQQRSIYHTENRRCGSDAQGNCQDDDGGEAGRFLKHA